MEQKTEIIELTTIEQADDFINAHDKVLIFKAGTCWLTDRAWAILQKSIKKYPEIPLAYVTVVRYRSVSDYIAEITATRHQSPQILILQGRTVLFERNSTMIDEAGLKKVIEENFKPVSVSARHFQV